MSGPLALDQPDIGLRIEAEVVFLAQDVEDDLCIGPGEFVIGREGGEVDQQLGLGETVEDRLDDLGSPVTDEDRLRGDVQHAAQLGGDHRVLRRVQFQQSPQLPGANHLALEVHQEELGGVGVGQEAGVDLQPQLGHELGKGPRAWGMSARLILEPLESVDQGKLARTQASASRRPAALSLELELSL